jgi:hypothetical protein
MAVSDIFTLKNSIAPRLIRCLYFVALIVTTVFVLLSVMRGVRIMTFTPPPGMSAPMQGMMQSAPQGNMMMGPRMANRGQMMPRRYPRMFGNPPLDGLFLIFWSLLRGAIAVMIVRILAEIGLAVLAMPRRQD